MKLFDRVQEVVNVRGREVEIDRYVADLRESLASSKRQFITYKALALASLVTYYLVSYRAAAFTFHDVQITDVALFRRVFLVVPAAFLAAGMAVGYLRLVQGDVYDHLSLLRFPELGKAGLHELRLPADYILGLDFLRCNGGVLGKVVSLIIALLDMLAFVLAPAMYISREAIVNAQTTTDSVTVIASVVAVLLSVAAVVIIPLANRTVR